MCLQGKGAGPPAIGLATLRKDGFVSLSHASAAAPGVVLTRPIAAGNDIRVNYAAEAGGTMRVALIDPATGAPKPGRSAADCVPLRGDSTSAAVSWKAPAPDQEQDRGATIQLQFHLQGAVELYSYAVA